MKLNEESWKMIEKSWELREESWKIREEAWKSRKNETPTIPLVRRDTNDAQIQTDHIVLTAESCQTDKVERSDFGNQVIEGNLVDTRCIIDTPPRVKQENISIIDILTRDFSSSSDDSSSDENDSRALESPEPKRFRPFDRVPISASSPVPFGPNVGSNSGLSKTPAGSKNDSEEKNDDETILKNSEVYKIYCRHENPKQAMESIKKMKNCLRSVFKSMFSAQLLIG